MISTLHDMSQTKKHTKCTDAYALVIIWSPLNILKTFDTVVILLFSAKKKY